VPRFTYPRPGCRTTGNVHAAGCDHEGTDRATLEGVYVDVISRLSTGAFREDDGYGRA
jgi:hypothetical protein